MEQVTVRRSHGERGGVLVTGRRPPPLPSHTQEYFQKVRTTSGSVDECERAALDNVHTWVLCEDSYRDWWLRSRLQTETRVQSGSDETFKSEMNLTCWLLWPLFPSPSLTVWRCNSGPQQHLPGGHRHPQHSQHARRVQPLGREQEETGTPKGGKEGPGQEDAAGRPQRTHVCSSR